MMPAAWLVALTLVLPACLSGPGEPPAVGVARVWRQRKGLQPTPGQLSGSTFMYDSHRKRVLLYGGTDHEGDPHDAMWQLDATGWTPLCGATSGMCTDGVGVISPAIGYDEAADRIVMFGGQAANGERVQTMWILEGDAPAFTQVQPSNAPTARAGAQLVYDPPRGAMLLFGGYDNVSFDDVYELDDKAFTMVTPLSMSSGDGPGGVASGAPIVAFDSDRSRFLALADFNTNGTNAEAWSYHPETGWDQTPADDCTSCFSPARTGAALVHLPGYDQTFVINGLTTQNDGFEQALDDTQALDDSAPELTFDAFDTASTAPTPRSVLAAIYDPTRDVVVTFGGIDQDTNPLDELWELGQP